MTIADWTVGAPGTADARQRRPELYALGDEELELVAEVHRQLIEELDAEKLQRLEPSRALEAVERAARPVLGHLAPTVVGEERDRILEQVCHEVLGLGPIEPLVKDPTVSEVMINAPDLVYYERDGIIYESPLRFRDAEHIMRIVDRIVSPLGRHIDEASPYVDARLADGSRVNVIIPPLAPKSPTVTIRKFLGDKYTVADLLSAGTLSDQLAMFLGACIKARLNTMISGGAGTGKTTLLNALSVFIPERERIVTIEDPAELRLQQRHVITLETRPPNLEGRNEVTQRDLVRNALRMRPDRIVVGEVRGAESFDMLQAMNTGHEGSLTTIHANSPRDALSRLENMVLMAGFELPVRAIREQAAAALHLIVQLARFADGSRKVVSVHELTGMEGQTVTMQELFAFRHEGFDEEGRVRGELLPTGIRPFFLQRLERSGVTMPEDLFLPVMR